MMDRPSRLHALLATPLLFVAMSSALGATTYTVTTNVLPAGNPGPINFSQAAYSASESSGPATIPFNRSGGKTGAVSVHYATAAGTAVNGKNYDDVTGTLVFADGDGAAKTFSVPLIDDHVVAPTQTVNLTLSSPTGGAGLGTASATLSILDADAGSGPPAAPTGLVAAAVATSRHHRAPREHPRFGVVLFLRCRQHRDADQGAQCLQRSLQPLLGLLRGDHQRAVHGHGDRHGDRRGPDVLQSPQSARCRRSGHERLRDLSLMRRWPTRRPVRSGRASGPPARGPRAAPQPRAAGAAAPSPAGGPPGAGRAPAVARGAQAPAGAGGAHARRGDAVGPGARQREGSGDPRPGLGEQGV